MTSRPAVLPTPRSLSSAGFPPCRITANSIRASWHNRWPLSIAGTWSNSAMRLKAESSRLLQPQPQADGKNHPVEREGDKAVARNESHQPADGKEPDNS